MTVKSIVAEKLREIGRDGLVNDYCGCILADLMPCCDNTEHCRPAYKWDVKEWNARHPDDPHDEDADFVMSERKP